MPAARRSLGLAALVLALTAAGAATQPQEGGFTDAARVTAVDVMVALRQGGLRRWLQAEELPGSLSAADFEVVVDGEARELIAVVPPGAMDPGREPWTVVLYFDLHRLSRRSLHLSANALAEQAQGLTDLGPVEVVLVGAEPRVRLAATRDAERLAGALGTLALDPPEVADTLLDLRYAFLEGAADEPMSDPATGAESGLVTRRLDHLLGSLTERHQPASRGLLVLVTEGWDLDPRTFYGGGTSRVEDDALRTATTETARTLAAYGWIAFAFVPPPPPAPPEGLAIGGWVFFGPKKASKLKPVKRRDPDTGEEWDSSIGMPMVGGVRRVARDPKRAAAELELGRALWGQGKREEAIEALRRAIYHYDGDKRTRAEQTEAWHELARMLETAHGREAARAAYERVAELDPERVEELPPGVGARLLAPFEALDLIAGAASGGVLRTSEALGDAIAGLSDRVRLTFQLSGPPEGELLPLSVRCRRPGIEVAAPAWTRSATPRTVAASRLRRTMAAYLDGFGGPAGNGGLTLLPDPPQRLGDRWATVDLGLADDRSLGDDGASWMRLSYGVLLPEGEGLGELRIEHLPPRVVVAADVPWRERLDLPLPGVPAWVAVTVEDLATGRWGLEVVEVGAD